jgi:hypothetical protein
MAMEKDPMPPDYFALDCIALWKVLGTCNDLSFYGGEIDFSKAANHFYPSGESRKKRKPLI